VGPSSLESGKGFGTSRGCAGIIVAEQDGSQSAIRTTAVCLHRVETFPCRVLAAAPR
jgi:hypothetical protein